MLWQLYAGHVVKMLIIFAKCLVNQSTKPEQNARNLKWHTNKHNCLMQLAAAVI